MKDIASLIEKRNELVILEELDEISLEEHE